MGKSGRSISGVHEMELVIILEDKSEFDLLRSIAEENKLTAEQYATNIVKGWIHGQMRGQYIQYAKNAPIADLVSRMGSVSVSLGKEK